MGYVWLFLNTYSISKPVTKGTVCIIKHTTGIPCPSCGTTRSVLELLDGHVGSALFINPLGFLIAVLMVLLPVWILMDILRKRNSFYTFYQQAEKLLRTPKFAIPLVTLVLLNWIWNITKNL
jgi:hypothetical protein